jgi:F-type H+-transporting ATPase subunit b
MKRLAILLLAVQLAAPCTWAQHEPGAAAENKAESKHERGEGGVSPWAWANFAILMAGLVYLFRKNATPYFLSRARNIRRGMIEAEDVRAKAERRMAAVEALLANLQTDIQTLRGEAMAEQRELGERMRRETAAALAKIRARAEMEIVSASKAARLELKRHTGQLAVALAEQKIRARLTPDRQDALVRGFVHHLQR